MEFVDNTTWLPGEAAETAGKRSDFFPEKFLYPGLGLRPGP